MQFFRCPSCEVVMDISASYDGRELSPLKEDEEVHCANCGAHSVARTQSDGRLVLVLDSLCEVDVPPFLRERHSHWEEFGCVRASNTLGDFLSAHGPWLEVGAGTGHLSSKIRERGGKSLATDKGMPGDWVGKNGRVHLLDAVDATRRIANRSSIGLLCSWPSLGEDWFSRATKMLASGQKLGYIGEWRGGNNAEDTLFDELEKNFFMIDECPLLRFHGFRDRAIVFKRN